MPRMSETDGEFIFSEEGGRGTPAASYFRKISSLASPKNKSSSKKKEESVVDLSQPVGAGHSHTEQHLVMPAEKKKLSKRKEKCHSYFDLDDDWDSTFDKPHPATLKSVQVKHTTPTFEQSELAARAERDQLNSQVSRILKFQSTLGSKTVDLEQLRNLSWSGVPADLRPQTWMHLLGYLPPTAERRQRTLERKRLEYVQSVNQVFNAPESLDQVMWHQISIDVPRTNPHIPLYQFETTQRSLERVLYLWAIRHPASGYVQGINDLLTPFFQTFLSEYVGTRKVEDLDPKLLTPEQLDCVEADSYWCLTKLLDGIQDNYIHAQPGIHRQVNLLETLVSKIDVPLVEHLKSQGLEFMQFSFRWMNCLLMREVPMNCTIRIWDTYLSEGTMGFSSFHVYVCAAFLVKFSEQLRQMDFQELMIFLQALPTQEWTERDVELVLSAAFMYQSLYRL